MKKAVLTLGGLLAIVLVLAVVSIPLGLGVVGFLPPLIVLLAAPLFVRNLHVAKRDFLLGFGIVVLISAVSALIGSYGVTLSGQSWPAALIGTGIGWFLGDTVSAILGLYVLAAFTRRARRAGLAD